MFNKNFKKQILIQDVQLDASVNFQTNGDINVYPCPWESDKVVTNGNRVKYKGGIEVDADGRTRVKRYNVGKNGPLYETIFETAHALRDGSCGCETHPWQRQSWSCEDRLLVSEEVSSGVDETTLPRRDFGDCSVADDTQD